MMTKYKRRKKKEGARRRKALRKSALDYFSVKSNPDYIRKALRKGAQGMKK